MNVANCTLIKPLTCEKTASIVDVAKLLRDNKQRRVIVVDKGEPVGIVSITDMNNKVVAGRCDYDTCTAADVMTSPVHIVCHMDDELAQIYTNMTEKESYFCPVVKDGEVRGILTYGELLHRMRKVLHES